MGRTRQDPESGDERPFHRGISRADVVAAALRVLDTEGRPGLTMRRVARDLDVEAPSLYTHVSSKDDLIDAVLDAVLDEVQLPVSSPAGRDAVVALAQDYRRVLVRHRAAVPLLTERARMSRSQARLVAFSISQLEAGGLSTTDAVVTHIALVAFVLGFVAQEVGRPADPDPGVLTIDPVMARAVAVLPSVSVDDRFQAGLDMILDGSLARRA